jgi:hypothetical protein
LRFNWCRRATSDTNPLVATALVRAQPLTGADRDAFHRQLRQLEAQVAEMRAGGRLLVAEHLAAEDVPEGHGR